MEKGKSFEFDPHIYPFNLIVLIGADAEYMNDRFKNEEAEGFGDDFENYSIMVNTVSDKEDSDRIKILVRLKDPEQLYFRNICHESFHVAINYCRLCNMSIGFEIGQDEHPAYIAGWFGSCITGVLNELEKEKED